MENNLKTSVMAGVRSSSYGVDPFPEAEEWVGSIRKLQGSFEDCKPYAIWIVGVVDWKTEGISLEFPSDGTKYDKITFAPHDMHEKYLKHFDERGINVFLQIEPAFSDVDTVIDLVLKRYGHHKCVKGFGIDVEWLRNTKGEGTKVTDEQAMGWNKRIKNYDSSYRLFLKHWDNSYMPPDYRDDLVFVDDSQQFEDKKAFLDEMKEWADYFYPNTVMYQYGYPADREWWGKLGNAPEELGRSLIESTRQSCGLIWVDFSLKGILL